MKKPLLILTAILFLSAENKAQNFYQQKKIAFAPTNQITDNGRWIGLSLSLKNGVLTAGSSGSLSRPWANGDPIYTPSRIFDVNLGTSYTAQRLTDVNFYNSSDYNTMFGTASATNGAVAVFGEPRYFEGVNSAESMGSATVFELSGGLWQPKQRLLASDKSNYSSFGTKVAINDDQIFIGTKVGYPRAGAVYIFGKDVANNWVEVQKLDPPAELSYYSKYLFGQDVAVSGDLLMISCGINAQIVAGENLAYIYKKNSGGTWALQQGLKVPTGIDFTTQTIAISGSYVALGGNDNTSNGESVLIFEKDASDVWSFKQKINDPDLIRTTFFATSSISLSGNLLAIGSPSNSTDENEQNLLAGSGAVYIYERNFGETWVKKQKIVANDRMGSNNFGYTVALEGNTLVTSSGLNFKSETGVYQASTYYEGEIYIFKNVIFNTLPNQASASFAPGRIGSMLFNTNALEPILTIGLTGANPIRGNLTTAKVWKDADEPTDIDGKPYLARHYEITPTSNALTSTGTITLYFNQQEFLDFNSNPAKTADFPTAPTDFNGIANLRILKISGSSSNGTGAFNTYSGITTTINPDDDKIIWNSTTSKWEVTFEVAGFSGFFATTEPTVLPLHLLHFSGKKENNYYMLNWDTASENNTSKFEIEKSENMHSGFEKIDELPAMGTGNNAYRYHDREIKLGTDWLYYRLKIIDKDGTYSYSPIITVKNMLLVKGKYTVFPNPSQGELTLLLASKDLIGSEAFVLNTNGMVISTVKINSISHKMDISSYPAGIYFIRLKNGETTKIIKQ